MSTQKPFRKKVRRIRRKVRYYLVFRLVQFLIFISNRIPRIAWLKLCGALGRVAYRFASETRQRTVKHLSMAFGKEKSAQEIKSLSVKVFEMLGKNSGDILRTTRVRSWADLQKLLVLHGFENYETANKKGKGVIFLTCHLGAH